MWEVFEPILGPVLVVVGGTIVTAATALIARAVRHAEVWFEAKMMVEIDDKHARLLTQALTTGVTMLFDKYVSGQITREQLVSASVEYAESSTPEAITVLSATLPVMEKKAKAAINELLVRSGLETLLKKG